MQNLYPSTDRMQVRSILYLLRLRQEKKSEISSSTGQVGDPRYYYYYYPDKQLECQWMKPARNNRLWHILLDLKVLSNRSAFLLPAFHSFEYNCGPFATPTAGVRCSQSVIPVWPHRCR